MASSASATNNLLETLPTRPPTPPRETQQGPEVSLKAVLSRTPRDPRSSLHTPPKVHSPSSAGATKSNPSSQRTTRKKVEWSAHTEYKDPPLYGEGARPARSSPLATPSSAPSKPVKGILKPSSSPNPLASSLQVRLDGSVDQPNIAEMLESTIRQLAGSDRDSRLDAYMMLARALKASNNLPDRVALQHKMTLFMQFIQRDIISKNDHGSPDTSLINHALTLLTTFLHFQAIASALTSDFGIFIIDHCIRSFDNPSTPKDIVRHLMQVVAFQTFTPKVMTMDRVGRLLISLHKVENHLRGKSIVMGRIQIYKRLIKQSRGCMAAHTDWLKDMFADMLCSIKEIQSQAISLGAEAGFALRGEKQVRHRVKEIMETIDEDQQKYIQYFIRRLEAMFEEKQCLSAVPHIWGVVNLFMRCPLDRWEYYSPWLILIQSAFNSTDVQTKLEANYAWNRYAYLSFADSKITHKILKILTQPLNSQLRRRFNVKQREEGMKLRKAVISGICNLYYYALRPNHDKSSIDVVWDVAIEPTMMQLIGQEGKPDVPKDSITQASRVLASLFDVSTPRAWKEERVRDMPPVAPEELPSLDSKWIRRNSDRIFKVVGPILERRFTDLANKESLTYRLWQALCGSIAVASAKDIKVSEETTVFTGGALGIICNIWTRGCPEDEQALRSKFLPSVNSFVQVLAVALGSLPFTEKKLSMTISNTFEPVATPSHRSDRIEKPQGIVRVPLHHLFSILCSVPPGAADDESLSDFVQSVFDPFFADKSIKARIELTSEMLRLLPRDTILPYGPWLLASQNLRLPLEQHHTPSKSHIPANNRLLGPDYREIVSLLERGLVSHPNLPSEQWFSLFDLLSRHALQECGDAGRALSIVEPMSKLLLDNFLGPGKLNQLSMRVMLKLYTIAKLPRDGQAIEAARRRLWGAPTALLRVQAFDPFDNFYKLTNKGLKYLYEKLPESQDESAAATFIESLTSFLLGTFPSVGIKSLLKVQDGIALWIQDEKAQLKLGGDASISEALRTLWNKICMELISMGRLDKPQFDQIEPLFTAAFRSKHRYVVNQMAQAWNFIVKDEVSLDCSDGLKSIVASLRLRVDLALPGVESSGGFGAQAQSFIDSQDDLSFVALSSTKSSRQETVQASPQVTPASMIALRGPGTRKRRREATPEVPRPKPSKKTPTPRLRHDSSQIQFAPIPTSSPLSEGSQNLTERQKEVRERQRKTTSLYSIMGSGPRTRSRSSLAKPATESASADETRNHQATPERTTSYEEFISSTPTPRRGHALQMEDYNDPPSSPPEPRRNPLLSEIQSRSKATTTMESWEFSSPPGSPVTCHQQSENIAATQQLAPTNGKAQSQDHGEHLDEMDVIPSSIINDGQGESDEELSAVSGDAVAEEPVNAPLQSPTPLPRQSLSTNDKPEEMLKPREDKFVDARSSPEPHLAAALYMASQDTSFGLDEIDEHSMMRFVVELESRRCDMPFQKLPSISPEKRLNDSAADCITVGTDSSLSSPPPEEMFGDQEPSVTLVAPSIPAEADMETPITPSGGKRKRKRGPKKLDGRRKRRRSVEVGGSNQANDTQPAQSGFGSSPVPSVRRSLRSRKYKDPEAWATSAAEHLRSGIHGAAGREADRDTDEELLSQLVSESNAASLNQSQADPVEERSVPEDSMEFESFRSDDEIKEEQQVEEGPKTSAIIEMMRGSLTKLREVSLSREEVYQMEDLLMDMKRELYAAESRGRQ